jgi:hypothetical protein
VDKAAIGAHRQHFYSQSLQFLISGGDRRQFRRSHKGEVPWIEVKDNPFPFVIGELDTPETYALKIGAGLKIDGFFSYAC